MTNPGAKTTEEGKELLQFIELLWRGKWIIAFCATVSMLIGGYYAFKVAVPRYAATARIALEVRDQQVVNLDSVISGVSRDVYTMNTEVEVIRSRKLVENLVRDLDLIKDPDFNPYLREAPKVSLGVLRTFVRDLILGAPLPSPPPTEEEMFQLTVSVVQGSLAVSVGRNTYLFDIRATTLNPAKSIMLANRLAELYLRYQVDTKFDATEYAVNFLSERVNELEEELKKKEDTIKALRANSTLVSPEALAALNIRAKDIRDRYVEIMADKTVAEQRFSELSEAAKSGDLSQIAVLAGDPVLARIAGTVPQDDALFRQRLETLIAQQQAQIDRLTAQGTSLKTSLDNIQEEIGLQTDDLVELEQMEREVAATRSLYDLFLTRLKETSVQIGLQRPDSRILSEASRAGLVEPRKTRILIFSIMLGAMAGVGLLLVRQFVNRGFRTTEELERAIGISVLGQVPKMPISKRKALVDYLRNNPTSAAAEAYRNLRTSILLSSIDKTPQIIMSTSSVPGEGKTTQAVSLAMNLSGIGKRVLLVECDIRRNTLKQYFPDTKSEVGMIEVMSGEVPLDQAVVPLEDTNIDILFGGKVKMNAADLFSSERFKALLEEARAHYDFVLVDTAPVLIVPDARIIGQHVDAIIFSVAWNNTDQALVTEGVRQFETVGLRVSGLVLSKVDARRMTQYGYGYRYGAYRGRGYYTS